MARKRLRKRDITILVRLVTEQNGKRTVTESETDLVRFKRWLKKNVPEDWKQKDIINRLFKPGYASWTKVSGKNFKMWFEFMRTSQIVWE